MRIPFSRTAGHDGRWGVLASASLDGELHGAEAERFRAHSHGCVQCQKRLRGFRQVDARLRVAVALPTPAPPQVVLEAARTHRGMGLSTGRVIMAASLILLLAGAASPIFREAAAGLVGDARRIVSPASRSLRAGQPGGSVANRSSMGIVSTRSFRLVQSDATGKAELQTVGAVPTPGPVFALAGGKVLYRESDGDLPRWSVAFIDGREAGPFLAATGMEVLDVTPGGDRILLRRADAAGGFSTAPGATKVVDADGALIWEDPGGADVYTLSPDGRLALSGESIGFREIPLAGGEITLIPLDRHPVHRPQISRDGRRAVFLAERIGHGNPDMALAIAKVTEAAYIVLSAEAVPASPPPVFRLSPDGGLLAVQSGGPVDARSVHIYDVERGDVVALPALRGSVVHGFSWSSDSSRLLILAERGDRSEVWIRGQDGQLDRVATAENVTAAVWLVDDSGIVYVASTDAAAR